MNGEALYRIAIKTPRNILLSSTAGALNSAKTAIESKNIPITRTNIRFMVFLSRKTVMLSAIANAGKIISSAQFCSTYSFNI